MIWFRKPVTTFRDHAQAAAGNVISPAPVAHGFTASYATT